MSYNMLQHNDGRFETFSLLLDFSFGLYKSLIRFFQDYDWDKTKHDSENHC